MTKEVFGNFTFFYDEDDLDEVADDVITGGGDEALEIAESEAIAAAKRKEFIDKFYKERGLRCKSNANK